MIVNNQDRINLQGDVQIPGDKSISHRSLMILAICLGKARISNLLESEDVLATKNILEELGVKITKEGKDYIVSGNGRFGFRQPSKPLDCGNSGTTIRLISGLLATQPITSQLFGDSSLSKRPMGRTIRPLEQFGTKFTAREGHLLPMQIEGIRDSIAIEYKMDVASAQVKSGVLLAGLHSIGTTVVYEKVPTRDHTEIMLEYLGFDLKRKLNNEVMKISLTPGKEVASKDLFVAGDPSSAAFIAALALLVEGSDLILKNVGISKTRIGFFDIIAKMGANIEYLNKRYLCGEEVADIRVRYSKLKAIETGSEMVPAAIDEYPILAVIAAFAEGETIFNGLAELRVKECDRLQVMHDNLLLCGVNVKIKGDSLIVTGSNAGLKSACIRTHCDHRIGMSFVIFAIIAKVPMTIDDVSVIATSFPNFFEIISDLGINISK
ncbi:MAG: 3-phosphoshikimate 1-carboxyvinyltransferase [Rickettsiales bacterium]|nr:3-phosphoshikimate 1-carboxyvinyltransferase [Rickettsiales bacterium]